MKYLADETTGGAADDGEIGTPTNTGGGNSRADRLRTMKLPPDANSITQKINDVKSGAARTNALPQNPVVAEPKADETGGATKSDKKKPLEPEKTEEKEESDNTTLYLVGGGLALGTILYFVFK